MSLADLERTNREKTHYEWKSGRSESTRLACRPSLKVFKICDLHQQIPNFLLSFLPSSFLAHPSTLSPPPVTLHTKTRLKHTTMDVEQVIANIITAEQVSTEAMMAEFFNFDAYSHSSEAPGMPETSSDTSSQAESVPRSVSHTPILDHHDVTTLSKAYEEQFEAVCVLETSSNTASQAAPVPTIAAPTPNSQGGTTMSAARAEHFGAVFVRLERVFLVVEDVEDEFRWNKRSGTWHDDVEDVKLGWLLDPPSSFLRVSIRPNGMDFPVSLVWDSDAQCFKGMTIEEQELIMFLEDLREMVRNPLVRQHQGYYMY